ncbi:EAL domain-containing protein [Dermatophilus congolensis]|uniref:EAL domain-containing protein n=1 Tax=Dermatophilus congolensis TaxID=1863 RepID=UPI001AAFAF17|nr:EAL domain-containing protein [Dermatophilus congolensis]MBO3131027.1 EAL domain-containing protein [Dermatophilus congolensis]MBO3134813.1 EAL domain-containing protein [Dermatophilus congolensis]MBO3137050.1 EAL domain-containing protein [Dermatophilus congolensis]MBO3139294.1 EAL domain-containing protein [Dermatophilus congolensis]
MTQPSREPVDTGALHNGQRDPLPLITYFQPFYNLNTGHLQGLEALARHRNSDGTTDWPADFFATAEKNGRMRDIDLTVLHDSLYHFARWQTSEKRTLILSVNLSEQFVTHRTAPSDIILALEKFGIPGDRLLVDITTTTFRHILEADPAVTTRLHRLQEEEISFCLDGFTADDLDLLEAAADFPVDILKLHPQALLADPDPKESRVRRIADTVGEVGLPMVAAGIETQAQLALMRDLGFEWAQGFYLGKPVQADQALANSVPDLNLE